ncbi:LysE family translocator [Leifsonia sp. NCR5]|uniref:LysE family translocator n=1 Tax=Leifsonia sp. NCR5 TaxID=1978342 RepID=UPI000A19934B|nr:LysE family translocator [Leifsonia sp. NCR5]
MVPGPSLLAFAIASIALIVIPGPSVLFVIGRSLSLGRVGGLLSVLGNALGMLPLVIAVSLGIGAVVAQSVVVFTIIKFAGAAYLMYLGIQAIRHRRHTAVTHEATPPARSRVHILSEGFVVGLTNPKTLVFFVAVLPQFVDYRAGSIPLQMFELGTVFLVLALACDSVWALAAGTARNWFGRSPKRVERLGAAGGVMMIGLGGVLALTGNKH